MRKPLKEWLGQKIREARQEAGFRSQSSFAIALDTEQATVSRWENGRNEPATEHLRDIARITKKPLSFFEPMIADKQDTQLDKAVQTLTRALESTRPRPHPLDDLPPDILDLLAIYPRDRMNALKLALATGIQAATVAKRKRKDR